MRQLIGPYWLRCALLGALLCATRTGELRALSPESPEVRRAIEKGLKFLEKSSGAEARLGGKCLMALAFLKNGADANHPLAVAATAACHELAKRDVNIIAQTDIYSLGIAIVFLCDLDGSKYHDDIEKLLHALEKRQKSGGGWGYENGDLQLTGDTSMTQYAVLGTWAAHRHGVAASQESVERVCNWLIRTQDPEGKWGYQGNDPGEGNYTRLKQSGNFSSLTAAGCGASYICADLLGFTRPIEEDKPEEGLPPSLKLVKEDPKQPGGKGPNSNAVEAKLLNRARLEGARWLSRMEADIPNSWQYYYLYALERYHSFRELSEGKSKNDPSWYNTGARYLLRNQKPDGSWESQCGAPADTSFGILFLSRGTKKSIEKTTAYSLGEGMLLGGQGLPTNLADVRVKRGRVVSHSLGGSLEELLTRLENPAAAPLADLAEVEELQLSEAPAERALELARLRQLLMKGRGEARVAAALVLSRTQELDSVPSLIFALGDPDRRVPPLANAGLKFISRRLSGYELSSAAGEQERAELRAKWKAWYRSIRPDGELSE